MDFCIRKKSLFGQISGWFLSFERPVACTIFSLASYFFEISQIAQSQRDLYRRSFDLQSKNGGKRPHVLDLNETPSSVMHLLKSEV